MSEEYTSEITEARGETMRYRIRVRFVRYLDMPIHASSVHKAHRLALKASERVPRWQWRAYKAIHSLDDRVKSNVELKIIHDRPQAEHLSDEPGVGEERQYQVTVEVCRWCDFMVEAPTKKAAIRKAASMDASAIVPPSAWDGYTSTVSEEDDLEPGDWEAE